MTNLEGEEVMYWSEGHNAEPLEEGRCCDSCNDYVVRFRIFCLTSQTLDKKEYEIQKILYTQAAVNHQLMKIKGEEE